MKLIRKICIFVLAALSFTMVAGAQPALFTPYDGYEYNYFEESVPAPVGYTPDRALLTSSLGIGDLNAPKDMYFGGDGLLYILDSGNGRIVVLDENLAFVRTVDGFVHNGEPVAFTGAQGMFVEEDGSFLVADTENQRILEASADGTLKNIILRPQTDLIAEDKPFSVTKVMKDSNGIIYALVSGINEGAVTYDSQGNFAGFFASNEVEKTAEVLLNYIWKRFMTQEQIKASKSTLPPEFTNFDLDPKGFIYTVTQSVKEQGNVRRLNFKGVNLLADVDWYGDLEWDRKIKDSVNTKFVDVDVDEDGYISVLDVARGRVFQYSKDSTLICIFGGIGDQLGQFKSATSVETHNGKVYVLDETQNNLTVFSPTEYVTTVKTALRLYDRGDYQGSLDYWNQVLSYNSNGAEAYNGIGRALDESEEYAQAMRYFRLAYNHKGYSDSFKEVRKEFVHQYFLFILLFIVLVIVGVFVGVKQLKKRFARDNEYSRSVLETRYTYPLFTAMHPFEGFENLKENKMWSMRLSIGILAAMFLGICGAWFLKGFQLNTQRPVDFNVFIALIQAFLVIFVFVIANWAVSTLVEGKGKLKEIFCMSCYAMVPFVVFMFVGILLSNVLTIDEAAFLTFAEQLGLWWSVILIFIGLRQIHQFTFGKTLVCVLATILGIAIIVFLAIMFFGLMQQVWNFIQSIYSELQLML